MKRISYLIILISILFFICSCKKDETLTIVVGKVDIVACQNLEAESVDLILRFFTSHKLNQLQVLGLNSATTYQTSLTKVNDNIYDVSFRFDGSISFDQVTIMANTQKYLFNIGHFQLEKTSSVSKYLISEHISLWLKKGEKYIETFSGEKEAINASDILYINNLTNNALVITSIDILNVNPTFETKVNSDYIKSKVVHKNSETEIASISINQQTNYQLGYVIVICYNYLGHNYQYYYNTYTNESFGDDSVMISSLMVNNGDKL